MVQVLGGISFLQDLCIPWVPLESKMPPLIIGTVKIPASVSLIIPQGGEGPRAAGTTST
jgi:hypothetical protein